MKVAAIVRKRIWSLLSDFPEMSEYQLLGRRTLRANPQWVFRSTRYPGTSLRIRGPWPAHRDASFRRSVDVARHRDGFRASELTDTGRGVHEFRRAARSAPLSVSDPSYARAIGDGGEQFSGW
jgi:hypothetical protein